MKVRHNIQVENTPVGVAVMEMLSDEMAVAHENYSDLTTDCEKKTTITITVEMSPAPGGFGMDYAVAAKSTLAGRKPFKTRMYANRNSGQLTVADFDPVQMNTTEQMREYATPGK